MDDYIDFRNSSSLLNRASGKHGDARDAGRGDASGENGRAGGACAAGQDDVSHDLGDLEGIFVILMVK